jgi:hypothetical protein
VAGSCLPEYIDVTFQMTVISLIACFHSFPVLDMAVVVVMVVIVVVVVVVTEKTLWLGD